MKCFGEHRGRVARQAGSLLLLCLVPPIVRAQDQASSSGPAPAFHDDLLDKMAGNWTLTGTIMGRPANHFVTADWVLNHQFLLIHGRARSGTPPYEAMVFIGYDQPSDRYVAHWIDVFGGRYSETLGYGRRSDNAIEFVFEYPDGPFHTTFRWDSAAGAWHWLMKQKSSAGQWSDFGVMDLKR